MKIWKKISIFVILSLVICMAFSTVVLATEAETGSSAEVSGKLDMDAVPESFGERAEIALQGTVTGMVMIFAVLGLLAVIMTLSKIVFHDIPNKKREKETKESSVPMVTPPAAAPTPAVASAPMQAAAPITEASDDGELAAVITAAIAAMIESGEYKNEFVGGFKVVSFKRSANSAWNRK